MCLLITFTASSSPEEVSLPTCYHLDMATVSTKQSFTKKCTVHFLCLITIGSTHGLAEVTFLLAVM